MTDTAEASVPLTPRKVVYCGVCSMPPEYCEFGGTQEKCKKWLSENDNGLYEQIYGGGLSEKLEKAKIDDTRTDEEIKLEEKRTKVKDKTAQVEAKLEREHQKKMASKILIKRVERTKRKCVTTVYGLEVFDVDLKKAAKMFASKFACGSSVAKNNQGLDEIVIQGDFADEVMDLIAEHYPNIPEDNLEYVEDKKKKN
ncbi:hypothetical protein BZG36_03119 [Bifiguratus adelaidae]|uniref:Translation machinery-associated protein 22 n=1 Tax=Bifiguratus adelaidae TaxID=1938954 RepID=A0A261Y0M3_9FUNG|nr:hypothetical protein BZG36_03119 [Bifiguratus adelaidae]